MKKKLIAIISIVLVLAIVIGIVCVCLVKKKDDNKSSDDNSSKAYTDEEIAEEILEVDEKINDFLSSEEYINLDAIEEKKEAVEDMLLELSEDGLVTEDSIDYHEDNKQFSFEYASGISSGVYLGLSFGDEVAGPFICNSSTSLAVEKIVTTEEDEEITIENSIMTYGWGSVGVHPYNNWKAVVDNCNQRNMNMIMSTDTTVEDYRDILLDKDFICIAEHGATYYPSGSDEYICVFAVFGDSINNIKKESYIDDISENRIYVLSGIQVGDKKGSFFLITPKFFADYYNNKLNDSIVYFSNCCGFGEFHDLNYEFARAFCDVGGATAAIGFHDSALISYSAKLLDEFTKNLMGGKSIEESLEKAKELYGHSDREYIETYNINVSEEEYRGIPAYPVLYKDEFLLSCEVRDKETYEVIPDVIIYFEDNNKEFGSPSEAVTITDEKGSFLVVLPFGSYSVSFHHDDYEYYGTTISFEGNSSVFDESILLTPKDDNTNDTPSSDEGTKTDYFDICAGAFYTVGLKSDGTVSATGYNGFGQCDVSGWSDIIEISAGYKHTVGLKSNGTVVATGDNSMGQCDVSGWTDIVAISADWNHTVGLKSNGTVVATGDGYYQGGGSQWWDVSDWTDIVAISTGDGYTIGLKSDGTVVATGNGSWGQCDVSAWTDIIAISAGSSHTVGLKSDGTVVAVGYNHYGHCDVSGWTDIVAISTGYYHTLGLKSDGTVLAIGDNEFGQCNVSDWTDIVAISGGHSHSVGTKSDGTIVVIGDNRYGQCDTRNLNN